MFPNWTKNILFLLVYMLSGLTLVIIIEGLLSGTELLPLNTAIEQAMIHLRTPFLTDLFVLVTKIGSPFIFSCVSLVIAILLFLKKNIFDSALLVVTILVSVVSLTVLKNVFQVSRPVNDFFSFTGWSFPSGHATMATAFFFITAYIFFNKVRSTAGKINLVAGSVLGILLVSVSRLYLGAHWTLDVLAGIALGLLAVSFTVLVFNVFLENWLQDKKKFGL